MKKNLLYRWVNYFVATVWLINGLICKVLNLVPRHQQIVTAILGEEQARLMTFLIGLAEIGMAVWILSGIQTRINAIAQIILIATMNTLEFLIAPNLLLWGKANAIFAFAFIVLIYYNEVCINKKLTYQKSCFPS